MKKRRSIVPRKCHYKKVNNGTLEYLFVVVFFSILAYTTGTDPTNFACTAVNATTIRVTWTQTSSALVAGYHLDVERVDGLKIEYGLPSLELNDKTYETYTFYGLGKFATYNVTIHSYFTSGGNGTDYVISCQTSSDIPDASNFNFSCTGISTSEITCRWDALETVYWNGNPIGYILGYLRYTNDIYTYVNLSTNIVTYTISNLYFDTWYVIQLQTQNDAGLSPFTSSPAKTLGWPVTVENKTRYFCYETIPGTIVWSWEEMPCTVYVGIILVFMLLSLIFMLICCCMCCCNKKTENNKSNLEVNIFNEQGENGDNDGYDDETETETEDDESDNEDNDYDYDSEGNPTEAAILAKKKRKIAEADNADESMDETSEDGGDSEDDKEYETSEVETVTEEEYESSEGDEDLDEDERLAKKEKKLAAFAAAKELRDKKRDEKAKRKAEKDKEREINKARKEEERARKKASKDEEKRKQREENEKKSETQKAEKDRRNAEKKKKKEIMRLNKQNKTDNKQNKTDDQEISETESDYESDELTDTDEYTENEKEDNKEEKTDSVVKKKVVLNRKKQNKKVNEAILTTVNEKSKKTSKANNKDTNYSAEGMKNKTQSKENSKNAKEKSDKKTNNKDENLVNDKQKRKPRKQYSDSDDLSDGSETDYYEDWNPDADDNPDTNVTRVNVKDINKSTDKIKKEKSDRNLEKGNKETDSTGNKIKSQTSKSANGKSKGDEQHTEMEYKKQKRTKKKSENDVSTTDYNSSENSKDKDYSDSDDFGSDDEYDDSDEYDSDDYYDSDGYECEDNESIDNGNEESKQKAKQKHEKSKKPGFFGKLFGNFNISSSGIQEEKVNNLTEVKKSIGLSDWDSEDDNAGNEPNYQTKIGQRSGLNGSGFGRSGYPGNGRTINNTKVGFLKGINSDKTTDFGDWGSDDDNVFISQSESGNGYSNSYANGFNIHNNNTNGVHNMDTESLNHGNDFTNHRNQHQSAYDGNNASDNSKHNVIENKSQNSRPDERRKFNALFNVNSRKRRATKVGRANHNSTYNYGNGQNDLTSSQNNSYGDGEDIFSTSNKADYRNESQNKYGKPISTGVNASNSLGNSNSFHDNNTEAFNKNQNGKYMNRNLRLDTHDNVLNFDQEENPHDARNEKYINDTRVNVSNPSWHSDANIPISKQPNSVANPLNKERNDAFFKRGNHFNNGIKSKKLVSFRNSYPQNVRFVNNKETNGIHVQQNYNRGPGIKRNTVESNYNGGSNPNKNISSTGQNYNRSASALQNGKNNNGDFNQIPNISYDRPNNFKSKAPNMSALSSEQNLKTDNDSNVNERNGRYSTGSVNDTLGNGHSAQELPNGQDNGSHNINTNGLKNGNHLGINGLQARPNYNGESNDSTIELPTRSNIGGNNQGINRKLNGSNHYGGGNQGRDGLPNGQTGNNYPNTEGLLNGLNQDGHSNLGSFGLQNGPLSNGPKHFGGNNTNVFTNGPNSIGANNPGKEMFNNGQKQSNGYNKNMDRLPVRTNQNERNNAGRLNLPNGPRPSGSNNTHVNGLPNGQNQNGVATLGRTGFQNGPRYSEGNNGNTNVLPPQSNLYPHLGVHAPSGPSENDDVYTFDADIVLPNHDTNRKLRSPVGKFVNKPAWNNFKADSPSGEKRRASKTPVKELMRTPRRVTLTDPEPVFETDRLAKKFPFLAAPSQVESTDTSDVKPNDKMRKNQSESNLEKLMGKAKPPGGLSKISSDPNISSQGNSDKNTGSINADTRDKIFYGFGVGRWRLVAAKWLNIWKMKRRPVKTGQSSWD